ncbi:MAG: glycosyltransferase family 4 protein [Bifidobacterium sp.]|nr:glycosyltransferase family 4 protein [Bifidobacterium sp.]
MRIAFVFDDTLDVLDGVQQHIIILGRELARRGHHVEYLVGQSEHSPVPGTHSLARNMMVSFNGNRMRIPVSANRADIRRVLREGDYDILDVQSPYSPMLSGKVLAAAAPSTGVVATYHIAAAGRMAHCCGKLLGTINRHSHRRVDEVVAVSPVAAEYARDTAHVSSTVIANPVDVQRLVRSRETAGAERIAKLHGNGPHVVFIGRFVSRKGARILLDALRWGEHHGVFPAGMHVTLGGKGPLLAECQAQAATLRTPVEFTGFVGEDDKPALLASADAAVFPSTGGESFGIVLLEAIAAGSRVVLAGDNPGYRSTLLNDDDALFPVIRSDRANRTNHAGDPQSSDRNTSREAVLARRITRALVDEPWAEAIHARQSALLQRYDVTTVADQVETVYAKAIADRATASAE